MTIAQDGKCQVTEEVPLHCYFSSEKRATQGWKVNGKGGVWTRTEGVENLGIYRW